MPTPSKATAVRITFCHKKGVQISSCLLDVGIIDYDNSLMLKIIKNKYS
jgi:hypothetical protein